MNLFEWCSCLDNSTRHVKYKHIFAIEFAIKKGTLRDIDKLPKDAHRYTAHAHVSAAAVSKSSYRDDDEEYDY